MGSYLTRSGHEPQPIQLPFDEATGCARMTVGSGSRGVRLVCVSDTHGHHRELTLPNGDVLVHAGDFTLYGKEEQAKDFNDWLAEQPHAAKLVVLGNHENNSDWNERASEVLSNATVLRQSSCDVEVSGAKLRFFGTDFFWPCKGENPYFKEISTETDVLIAHGPAKGCADGGKGCPSLLEAVKRSQPELVISGHVHFARGAAVLSQPEPCLFANVANCGSGKQDRVLVHGPVVLDL